MKKQINIVKRKIEPCVYFRSFLNIYNSHEVVVLKNDFQAIPPFCLCTFPVCMVFMSVLFRVNIPNLGLILVIITNWIPVLNPLTTLILLHGYRRRFIINCISFFSTTHKDKVEYFAGLSSSKLDSLRRKSVLYHIYDK